MKTPRAFVLAALVLAALVLAALVLAALVLAIACGLAHAETGPRRHK